MTASRSLPARPSLESLRKQAKKLARDRSVPLRNAQLALAREYGYAGWQDLIAEVSKRLGSGLASTRLRQILNRHATRKRSGDRRASNNRRTVERVRHEAGHGSGS